MMLVLGSPNVEELDVAFDDPFPQDVEFVISALEAGPRPAVDRHSVKRTRYRVRALLQLYSAGRGAAPVLLYGRSVSEHALGFLCGRQLPLSHGGALLIPKPDGGFAQIACTVLRCRPAAAGWFEGAVRFNRPQYTFAAEQMEET
jgi:hypothetical protein